MTSVRLPERGVRQNLNFVRLASTVRHENPDVQVMYCSALGRHYSLSSSAVLFCLVLKLISLILQRCLFSVLYLHISNYTEED
jgi:hypothetical protein